MKAKLIFVTLVKFLIYTIYFHTTLKYFFKYKFCKNIGFDLSGFFRFPTNITIKYLLSVSSNLTYYNQN